MLQGIDILPNGTLIQGRYLVEKLLGKGGFGAVYCVRDQRAEGSLFALKEVLDSTKQERNRLILEGELLRRLHHRALPNVYEVFDDEEHAETCILMEYIEGTNLEILRRQQPEMRFSLSEVFIIMEPIFDAVAYLHSQHPPILHRDIKPANIILTTIGEKSVLVDFGISKEYDPQATTTAIRHCSPGYGAPEQYGIGTNTRTDIYGLGATLYTLLTGSVPTDALIRMTQLGNKEINPLEPVNQLTPTVPLHIAEVIHRAMSIRSDDRFTTVEEFWQALHDTPTEQDIFALRTSQTTISHHPLVTSQAGESTQFTFLSKQLDGSRFRRGVALALIFLALFMSVGMGASFLIHVVSHPGTNSVPPAPIHGQHATPTVSPTPRPTVAPTAIPPIPPIPSTFHKSHSHHKPHH